MYCRSCIVHVVGDIYIDIRKQQFLIVVVLAAGGSEHTRDEPCPPFRCSDAQQYRVVADCFCDSILRETYQRYTECPEVPSAVA